MTKILKVCGIMSCTPAFAKSVSSEIDDICGLQVYVSLLLRFIKIFSTTLVGDIGLHGVGSWDVRSSYYNRYFLNARIFSRKSIVKVGKRKNRKTNERKIEQKCVKIILNIHSFSHFHMLEITPLSRECLAPIMHCQKLQCLYL